MGALLALLLMDIVLVGLLLRPRNPLATVAAIPATSSPAEGFQAPTASASASRASSPSARLTGSSPNAAGEETPSASSSPRGSPEPGPRRVLLDLNSDLSLRASPGSCQSDDASLERSTDGRNWEAAELPTHALLALTASSTEVSLVGTDTSCAPEKWLSDDGGLTWREVDAGKDWYLLTAEPKQVHAPGGSVRSPCRRSLDLAPTGKSGAALLCGSGSTYLTRDAGQSWSRGDGVEGAVELTFLGSSTGWALVPRGKCPTGLAVLATTDGAASWQRRACLDVPGKTPLGLAFRSPDDGLLQAGDATYSTTDGGRTWRAAPAS